MAIDTAAKRLRMLDFDLPTAPGMPPPDATIDIDDRAAFLWLYLAGTVTTALPVRRDVLANLAGRQRVVPHTTGRQRVLTRSP